MNWEAGNRYRCVGVTGQIAIKKNPKTQTRYVEAQVEVTKGPLLGQRIKWRGYMNTRANAERTVGELRVTGVRSQKLGDFSGFGTREFEGTCMIDVGEDGKKYPRITFLREVPTLSEKDKVGASDVEELNREFGDLMTAPAAPPPPRVNVGPASEEDFYEESEAPEQREFAR